MGLDPAPKTVRSPLARGQALAGRPECDHTPEERCVTTFFHRRPHPPSHVTTFPQSADRTAAEGVGSGSGGSAMGAREPGASRAKVARGEARSERRVREDALGEIGHGKVERRVLRRAYGLASDVRVHRFEHLAHELLAHPRQARRLATRVSGHALGPQAALTARFFLRRINAILPMRSQVEQYVGELAQNPLDNRDPVTVVAYGATQREPYGRLARLRVRVLAKRGCRDP